MRERYNSVGVVWCEADVVEVAARLDAPVVVPVAEVVPQVAERVVYVQVPVAVPVVVPEPVTPAPDVPVDNVFRKLVRLVVGY